MSAVNIPGIHISGFLDDPQGMKVNIVLGYSLKLHDHNLEIKQAGGRAVSPCKITG